jgi:DNA polymerase-3 subunit alpha
LLGLYVSEHPYNNFRPYLVNYATPIAQLGGHKGDDRIVVAGVISTIKKIITRKGESMLFVKLEDATSTTELLVFPRLLKESAALWAPGQAVIMDGKVSEKDQESKVLVNRVMKLDIAAPRESVDAFKKMMLDSPAPRPSFRPRPREAVKVPTKAAAPAPAPVKAVPPVSPSLPPDPRALRLTFLSDPSPEDVAELHKICSQHPGDNEVRFRVTQNGKAKIIKTPFRVDNNEILRKKLQAKFSDKLTIAE